MQKNDIVQITDADHPWFPALLIVSEVKSWGVQAYAIIPITNDHSELPGEAFNRLNFNQIAKVGEAVCVHMETPEA